VKSNIRPARPSGKIIVDVPTLKQVIAGFDSQTRQELFDYLLLLRQQDTNKTTTEQERGLNMLSDSLNNALGDMLGNYHHIFPLTLKSQLKKVFKDVIDFMSENDLDNLKTEETKAMFNILAKILVKHASGVSAQVRIPLSMKLVLQTTTPIVSLFDNFFPGYVKAKLVKQILLAAKKPQIEGREDD
jgi:hypothetical protein